MANGNSAVDIGSRLLQDKEVDAEGSQVLRGAQAWPNHVKRVRLIGHLRNSKAFVSLLLYSLILGGICFAVGYMLPRRALFYRYVGTSALLRGPSSVPRNPAKNGTFTTLLEKPVHIKVVGFMFFGRRKYVDILDCFLRKNLALNGGFLDQVLFIMDKTWDQNDKAWLENLVQTSGLQDHYIIRSQNASRELHWTEMWGLYINEPDTIYVKLDDDLVYIADNAIPRIVHTLIANPTAHSVQANIINCHQNEWFHLHTGATLPFLPDLKAAHGLKDSSATRKDHESLSWRHSALPIWQEDHRKKKDSFDWTKAGRLPFIGHRWLPLEPTPENMAFTPIWQLVSNPEDLKFRYSKWTVAAQEHYSLFYHLEQDTLGAYYWGDVNGIWNPWYKHYDVNLMAIRGQTVLDTDWWDWPLGVNDQWALTQTAPKIMKRPFLIDTHALAAHFAFSPQEAHLLRTDLLDRYRAYANEKICDPSNQKTAFHG